MYSRRNKQSAPQPSYPPYSSVSPSENAPGILYSTISKVNEKLKIFWLLWKCLSFLPPTCYFQMENTSSTPSYPSSSINQAQNDLTRQLRDSGNNPSIEV